MQLLVDVYDIDPTAKTKVFQYVNKLYILANIYKLGTTNAIPCSYSHYLYTVQLRCNFTLAHEQFIHTLEPFTRARIELLVASVLLPMRNSRKIIR